MKEPGRMLFDLLHPGLRWGRVAAIHNRYAAIEAAVRADERERCAKVADWPPDATATTEPSDRVKGRREAAAAIRKLGETP